MEGLIICMWFMKIWQRRLTPLFDNAVWQRHSTTPFDDANQQRCSTRPWQTPTLFLEFLLQIHRNLRFSSCDMAHGWVHLIGGCEVMSVVESGGRQVGLSKNRSVGLKLLYCFYSPRPRSFPQAFIIQSCIQLFTLSFETHAHIDLKLALLIKIAMRVTLL